LFFFFSSRRRHTRSRRDWSSDVCSSDLGVLLERVAHGLVLAEALQDLVGGPTEGLEQDGDALLALPVDADTDEVTLVDLELQPRSEERRVGTACRSRRSAGREYGA